jgi:hypothetical protein
MSGIIQNTLIQTRDSVSLSAAKYSSISLALKLDLRVNTLPHKVSCLTTRSKAWIVFALLITEIVGSNHTRGMDVSVYSVFALSSAGSDLATDWTPTQGILWDTAKERPRFIKDCRAYRVAGIMLVPDSEWLIFYNVKTKCLFPKYYTYIQMIIITVYINYVSYSYV